MQPVFLPSNRTSYSILRLFLVLFVAVLAAAPAVSARSQDHNFCGAPADFWLGQRSLTGHLAGLPVELIRDGNVVFGSIAGENVRWRILGTEAAGYYLRGSIGGGRIKIPIHGNAASGRVEHCRRATVTW